jgi:hypothetical protein
MEDKFIYKLSVGMVIFGLLIIVVGFVGQSEISGYVGNKTNIDWLWVMAGGLIIALGFYLNTSGKKR